MLPLRCVSSCEFVAPVFVVTCIVWCFIAPRPFFHIHHTRGVTAFGRLNWCRCDRNSLNIHIKKIVEMKVVSRKCSEKNILAGDFQHDNLTSLYSDGQNYQSVLCPLSSVLSSGLCRLSSVVYRLSSVCPLSSVVCRLSSVVCRLSSSVLCPLSSVVCRLSSVVCRLSSVVCRLSSVLCCPSCPPSSVLCPLSSVVCPLSSVLCPLSSVLCPLSSVLCLLSSVLFLCPLSSVFCPLSSSSVLCRMSSDFRPRPQSSVLCLAGSVCWLRSSVLSGTRGYLLELASHPSYLASRAVVREPSCGKRAKQYESADASKRLAPYKLHAKSLAMLETCVVVISHSLLSHGGRHGPAPIFSFLSRLQPYLDNTHIHHFQQVMSPDQRFIQNHCKNILTPRITSILY